MKTGKRSMAVIGMCIILGGTGGVSETAYAASKDEIEEVFWNYVDETLIPQYGVMNIRTEEADQEDNWKENDFHGLLSATIKDFDNDEQPEMLTVQFSDYSEEKGVSGICLVMYEYQDSGEITTGASKKMDISGYTWRSIGYRQTSVFTYEYQGETYIALDNYWKANESIVTVSFFQYGKSGFEEMFVPHTDQSVYRAKFDYAGGVGYQVQGIGDIYVRNAESEPGNPLFCGDDWDYVLKFTYETDPDLTEEEQKEYMDTYRNLLESHGLKAEDERIGMSQNGGWTELAEGELLETAPDIYTAEEGDITFISAIYTDRGSERDKKQLFKKDYQKTLDKFRTE